MKTKLHTLILSAVISAAAASVAHADATVTVSSSNSGRITESGGDLFNFGDAATVASFTAESGLVGDNPSNQQQLGMWCYLITEEFAAIYNAGGSVELDFESTYIFKGGGSPGDITFELLTVSSQSSATTVLSDIVGSETITTLGTIPGDSANGTEYSFEITSGLNTTLSSANLAVGEYIWIGVNGGLSINNEANNGWIGGNEPLTSTLTAVPEPAAASLILSVGAALLFIRRVMII